jgi:hypothetical protein
MSDDPGHIVTIERRSLPEQWEALRAQMVRVACRCGLEDRPDLEERLVHVWRLVPSASEVALR